MRFNRTIFKPTNSGGFTYKQRQAGFTVAELMITLAVASLLLSLAAPSLSQFAQNSRLRARTFDLLDSIGVARSEAVKRGAQVVLCRSANGTSCGGTANTWTTGWLVYVNTTGTLAYEAGDTLLRVGTGTSDGTAIITNSWGNQDLDYRRTGATNEGGPAVFAICDSRGGAYGRSISVAQVGRAALTHGSAGTPINCAPPG